jgi:hypothetical protein
MPRKNKSRSPPRPLPTTSGPLAMPPPFDFLSPRYRNATGKSLALNIPIRSRMTRRQAKDSPKSTQPTRHSRIPRSVASMTNKRREASTVVSLVTGEGEAAALGKRSRKFRSMSSLARASTLSSSRTKEMRGVLRLFSERRRRGSGLCSFSTTKAISASESPTLSLKQQAHSGE